MIDWQVVATVAAPVIALFVGVWVNRRFENRPSLISYYGHIASFNYTPPQGQAAVINTHSVVLRNAGRQTATNVRIGHNFLPDFNVWPPMPYTVNAIPGGTQEVLIPALIPGEEITISYLYFPPVTVAQIHAGIKCDQGFAKAVPVLLQRQFPRWVNALVGLLMVAGAIAILYVLVTLASEVLQ
jgi:hypothetical protein